MDDLIERVQSAIDRPDKPNIIGMHVDDAKALLARIKHTERQIAAACAYSAAATAERDANEALDAMLAKAREDALREAASLSWLCFHKCDVEVDVVTADDILALIQPEDGVN